MTAKTTAETTKPSGSDAPTCSVSSVPSATPETDSLWDPIRGSAFWENHPARLLSEKLERERDMLAERERKCPTMLECEARALLRALQEICDAVGMLESASPAQIVNRVRQISNA